MNTNTKDEFIKEILETAEKKGIKAKVVKIEADAEEKGFLKVKVHSNGKKEVIFNSLSRMEILLIVWELIKALDSALGVPRALTLGKLLEMNMEESINDSKN